MADIAQTHEVTGPVRPVTVMSFVESADSLCVEATLATGYGEIQTYELYVLQAGVIIRQFSGALSQR